MKMQRNTDQTNAFLVHLSGLATYIFPFAGVIVPLILWHTIKEKSRFLDEQGKEAVNFNISFFIYYFIAGLSIIPNIFMRNSFLILGSLSLVTVVLIVHFVLVVIAAKKSYEGENYQYPLTIKFIK